MPLNDVIKAIAGGSTATLIAVMTIVQLSPIKINPWSFIGKIFGKIARKIGKAINSELYEKVEQLEAKIENICTEVKSVKDDISETKAIDCRTRILHFGDEVLHRQKHTKEHFDEILKDIKTYEIYCKNHPSFPNHTTVLTSKRIKEIYEECLKNGDFL